MNIVMMTNTYAPHVGGVSRSVEQFARELRRAGCRVLVVAPQFESEASTDEVLRVPSVRHFNGSTFSLPLPTPHVIHTALDAFQPDIVHSHHPFLLGDAALRAAASRGVPIVFTHHTLYEKYTHYVVGDSRTLQRFVTDLAVGYGELCDAVVAPSASIHDALRAHGAETRIEVIPTGVDIARFAYGDGRAYRRAAGVPDDALLLGHVGRLAPEKNLDYLASAVSAFVASRKDAWFLVAGDGPSEANLRRFFEARGASERLVTRGVLKPDALVDAYHAMDAFVFSSQSETQGMVLTEAMAAGVPVIALDGPGVRETVVDGQNGRLLAFDATEDDFVAALDWLAQRTPSQREELARSARATAELFSMERSTRRVLSLYEQLVASGARLQTHDRETWSTTRRRLAQEWGIWENVVQAASDAVLHVRSTRPNSP